MGGSWWDSWDVFLISKRATGEMIGRPRHKKGVRMLSGLSLRSGIMSLEWHFSGMPRIRQRRTRTFLKNETKKSHALFRARIPLFFLASSFSNTKEECLCHADKCTVLSTTYSVHPRLPKCFSRYVALIQFVSVVRKYGQSPAVRRIINWAHCSPMKS